MPIQQTTSLRKIASLKKPIWCVRGSQGSGKTYSISILLVNHLASTPKRSCYIISAELSKMRDTVLKDFINILEESGVKATVTGIISGQPRVDFPNKSFVRFIGLDKEDVGKGLRCDIAYFNEVNKCNQESYTQVASRADKVIMDYNPDAEFFVDEFVITDPDCDFLQLTFQDNELLGKTERKNILKYKERGYNEDGTIKDPYWANKWQVYGLGNIGNLQGAIFNNWEIIDELPKEAELISYGLDWGFTNDPTALVAVYKYNESIIIDELIYQTGLTNSMLYNKIVELKLDEYAGIVADSSDPKSIQDLINMGYQNCFGAKKGVDSVMFGIGKMQEYKILITKRSTNAIKEFRAYRWSEDRNGKSLGIPVDKDNHIIDPVRYVFQDRIALDNWMEIS